MPFELLEVDLTTGKIGTLQIPDETVRKYIGGRGLGAKLLLDLLPKDTDPLSPDNVMIWLTGPLTGSLVPGFTKHVVITKSPVSGGYVDSYSSAGIGTQLVYSGYNGLIVKGRSDKPSYLYIKDNDVEIRNAESIWGKDSFEASQLLLSEVGDKSFGHTVIGPAGENMVKFACINNDYFRQAARGGVGAVMGSKRLKAIVAKGTGGVSCNDIEGFLKFHKEKLECAKENPGAQAHKKAGTSVTFDVTQEAGMVPTMNFKYGHFEEASGHLDSTGYIIKSKASVACLGCPVPCGKIIEYESVKRGKFRVEGPEYETAALLGSNLGISDLDIVSEANVLCDKLGMDTISAGNVIGFIMEANEKGFLNKDFGEQTDIKFGEGNKVLQLLEDIAFRRGIGDIAAEGVAHLAESIGHDSISFAMQSKGLEFPAYDPRRAFGAGLAFAVSPRGACHRRAWPPAKEVLGGVPPYTVEGKALMVKEQYDERNILHSLIACDFPTFAVPISLPEYDRYLRLVTGYGYTEEEYAEIADRIETTIRYFNYREGLNRKSDSLPKRFLEEPMLNGPAEGKSITKEGLEYMLSDYYKLRGWDEEGMPTEETLKKYNIKEGAL